MKTVGKIAALAMTLSLAFVLSACGGSASSSSASSSASSAASAAASSASASAESASASAASEAASSESAAASEAASEASESAATPAADADTYTNEFFGIKFNLPEGWSFKDVSALKEANSMVSAAAANATVDMAALSPESNQIVIVGVEAPSNENAGKSAEDYLAAQEEQMKKGFGDNYAFSSESATMSFDGIDRELPASVMNVSLEGNKLCICEAVAEKDGNFFDVIAMGANEEEVMNLFKNFESTTK